MTDRVNPYSPPQSEPLPPSWWSRITSSYFGELANRPKVKPPDFARGDAIICGGIGFFIDPSDQETLYAGSPSSDNSDARFALVAREAIRYLPEFLAENEHAVPRLDDRRMVVRIVNDYGGIFSGYTRSAQVLPAPLAAGLGSMDLPRGR